jgi:nitrate reductase gamma subunit
MQVIPVFTVTVLLWHTVLFLVPADINQTLINFANILIAFSGGACIIMLVIGGYLFMTSEGNPRRREYAYGALAGAAIGLMIVLLAPSLVSTLTGAVAK